MKNLRRFERELLQEGKYKEVCNENHNLIENKYIEVFGIENYKSTKENTKNSILNHYKTLKKNIEIQEDYLFILPYAVRQLFLHFSKKGLMIENMEQFLEYCK